MRSPSATAITPGRGTDEPEYTVSAHAGNKQSRLRDMHHHHQELSDTGCSTVEVQFGQRAVHAQRIA
jgi:hypothetical protein